jgi:signal transduction histidine kinase/CheY-like chemotaxis protein/HAMP domain-containing protein
VARGDLSKKITVDVKGEILELKNTINTMVDQLGSFASEVTRVAREVGTEGKLGGQARVEGVAGTWKDLTENVNMMATNLTNQVRGIAAVVSAVARGDLTRKLTVAAKGEIAALAETINEMIDTLATFGDQVTNVAREVGTEGKLGGQARVPGAAGLWRDLTDNVNQLAANLTTQVRAIAEVATAVTKGDLTRSITVEASGEVAALKDNINEMIRNLKDTTLKNTEQDWLKTNLTRFTRLLQGERDLVTVSNLVLSELAPLVGAQHGVFYVTRQEEEKEGKEGGMVLELLASYAFKERKGLSSRFRLREGLVGQCAFEKQRILLAQVPDDYIRINSGLGEAKPINLVVLPVVFEGEIQAVLELASFNRFSETHLSFLDQLMESIGIVLNTIAANMRTEDLLKQSQKLAEELQSQQEELKTTNDRLEQQAATLRQSEDLLKAQQDELRRTNEELQEKARLLAVEKKQVETTNREVELAKQAVEEKAEQLAQTSRYKSEFLANMSHELRTPLNSMLVLSKLLAENPGQKLTEKQVEFAKTIYSSGCDLLSLINQILDLSKIESGAVTLEFSQISFDALRDHLTRTFDPLAAQKGLKFTVTFDKSLPARIYTDEMRLQQILLNLLSNAFKFTKEGEVSVHATVAKNGWSSDHPILSATDRVLAFSVTDTGIGISKENQSVIFEAFQQGDGSTNRKYGGTGLGLSICRELTRLFGGEITLDSALGRGSTFTLYLPLHVEPLEMKGKTETQTSRGWLPPRATASTSSLTGLPQSVADDRDSLDGTVPAVLIVEDDPNFAYILLEIARENGLKGVVAGSGREALNALSRLPIDAVTFDIGLRDMDGWALLDQVKHSAQTRHIPLHIVSVQEQRQRALGMGAFGYTCKPADRDELAETFLRLKAFVGRDKRHLLVVQDSESPQTGVAAVFNGSDIMTTVTKPGTAEQAVKTDTYDCVVVDLRSIPSDAAKLLGKLRNSKMPMWPPVIVYTPDGISGKDMAAIKALRAKNAVRIVSSEDALLSASTLFLHRPLHALRPGEQEAVRRAERKDPILAGMKVAIIDDDVRNIFSLTNVLEQYDIEVVYAEDGRSGIELLKSTPGIGIVLIDIMMPEMDGYETIGHIRRMKQFRSLPLIAVTAKAMKEDRDKCLDAGASDYIAKPVDTEQLISTLRAWAYPTRHVA